MRSIITMESRLAPNFSKILRNPSPLTENYQQSRGEMQLVVDSDMCRYVFDRRHGGFFSPIVIIMSSS